MGNKTSGQSETRKPNGGASRIADSFGGMLGDTVKKIKDRKKHNRDAGGK